MSNVVAMLVAKLITLYSGRGEHKGMGNTSISVP